MTKNYVKIGTGGLSSLERQGSCVVCLKAQEQSQAALHLSGPDMSSPPHHALETGACETGVNAIFFFFNKGVWERLRERICWILRIVCVLSLLSY